MKMVAAVVKHRALDGVKAALTRIGVQGMTVVEAKGFGRQKGHMEIYRTQTVEVQFLPKVKIEVAIDAGRADEVVKAIIEAARTGKEGEIGDGKIFVYSLENIVRIRTGETGTEAL